jgi:hypothetical protein
VDKITITIDLGNDTMSNPDDVAKALIELAKKVKAKGIDYYPIMDSNGNKVGECNVE